MTRLAHTLTLLVTVAMLRTLALADRARSRAAVRAQDDDRGDVPGWVMITVMTAIVTIVLVGVFQEQVVTAVRNAFDSVNKAGNTTP